MLSRNPQRISIHIHVALMKETNDIVIYMNTDVISMLNMIIEMIDERTTDVDIMLVEIGGTVGDIESLPFLEAIRQMRLRYGPDRCMFIHLGYIPYLTASGEHKTKPIQHSTKTLSSYGIQPDMLICRSDTPIKPLEPVRAKLSIHTNLPADRILFVPNLSSIYLVPLMLQKQRLDQQILKHFTKALKNTKFSVRRTRMQ